VDEVPLEGGNVSGGVVRVGDTVRRPVGEWTSAVHALLRHLDAAGFAGAPRALGFDDKGREILTYVPGVSLSLEASHLLESTEGVAKAGALVTSLHTAMRSFIPPEQAAWWTGSSDAVATLTMTHGDLAPWNVIVDGDDWYLIDWDSACPGRFVWEAAYSLHTFAMLWPDTAFADTDAIARIQAFGDGARLSKTKLGEVLCLVPRRTRAVADMIDSFADRGHCAFTVQRQEGHVEVWRRASEHVASRLQTWLAGVNRPTV
jgi:Ser/Thr protein kinase RdoA (MazF antagonist)